MRQFFAALAVFLTTSAFSGAADADGPRKMCMDDETECDAEAR